MMYAMHLPFVCPPMDYCKQSSIRIRPFHSVSIRCAHAPIDNQTSQHMCNRMRADPCTHELALTCLYLRCIVVFFCGRRNRHRTVGRRASPNPQKLLFPQLAWSVLRCTRKELNAKSPFPAQVLGGKNNADCATPGREQPSQTVQRWSADPFGSPLRMHSRTRHRNVHK